ncbi:MAG: transcription antitermination factor NusB [Micrococcales bacterium]|nr:transcription antitermination factor NusB [Micrococcales bacterium]HBB38613.1 transcription antitermination factor NusB [Aquiluna sp.]MBT5397573.1 transcription antitermination factor NusB [Micrococcales bacterium]MBT5430809.1 transcription antitermination factor NusB [Micrococcales bacterium]MBT5848151.1 transcription antitermination factor NusB [Micrococcales bacterium]
MSSRSKSRKRALDALYASEIRGGEPLALLQETAGSVSDRQNQEAIFDYAESMITGFDANKLLIDNELRQLADGWALERMPSIDRAILRLGAWEILYNPDVPNEVAIAEAVALASEYSTDDSPKFVNGVLAKLARGSQAL